MTNRDAAPASDRLLSLPGVMAWFATCAGLAGVLGFPIGVDIGWSEDLLAAYIIPFLMVGGGIAGGILYKPVRRVAAKGHSILAAFLGLAVALLALEIAVTLTLLALRILEWAVLPIAWVVAPLYSLPVLLTAGPLSGIGLVIAAYFRDSFR